MSDQDLRAVVERLAGQVSAIAYYEVMGVERQNRQLALAGRTASFEVRRKDSIRDLSDVEFRVTSQWGEDGIIDWLVEHIPMANTTFVEFGVENYQEANTRFLLQNRTWRGLVLDGSADHMNALRREALYWRHDVTAVNAFITRDNINDLIGGNGYQGDIGLLSVDIDGNDYWVLEALTVVRPRILVMEYNGVLGDQHAITIPYAADFDRLRAHHSGQYFGASIRAVQGLAERKGYRFVGTCSNGVNAFFVREDLFHHVDGRIETKRAWPSQHRDSRNEQGALTHTRGVARADLIKHLPVVLTEDGGRQVELGSLMPLYSPEWTAILEGAPE